MGYGRHGYNEYAMGLTIDKETYRFLIPCQRHKESMQRGWDVFLSVFVYMCDCVCEDSLVHMIFQDNNGLYFFSIIHKLFMLRKMLTSFGWRSIMVKDNQWSKNENL